MSQILLLDKLLSEYKLWTLKLISSSKDILDAVRSESEDILMLCYGEHWKQNIVASLQNICDYNVESSYEDTNFRVNFLHSNNVKDIEILDEKPKRFAHILRFYK